MQIISFNNNNPIRMKWLIKMKKILKSYINKKKMDYQLQCVAENNNNNNKKI